MQSQYFPQEQQHHYPYNPQNNMSYASGYYQQDAPAASGFFGPPVAGLQPDGSYQGSNAEYYNQPPPYESRYSPPPRDETPRPLDEKEDREPDAHESQRNLGGTLIGGATGYYLGRKRSHGLLGAVGGALLGNFIGEKLKDRDDDIMVLVMVLGMVLGMVLVMGRAMGLVTIAIGAIEAIAIMGVILDIVIIVTVRGGVDGSHGRVGG
ncbi:hypothetical protein MW887_008632 [Aspergillus wentii]|nr:hypothetical protein MW887_008632 [Aspergillus wentii]